jgi:hypothetical protein
MPQVLCCNPTFEVPVLTGDVFSTRKFIPSGSNIADVGIEVAKRA